MAKKIPVGFAIEKTPCFALLWILSNVHFGVMKPNFMYDV